MKHMVLLILVLFLMVNLAEGGCLGKGKFNLPAPSAKTSVTPTDDHPNSDKIDFRHELASTDLLGSPRHTDAQLLALRFPPYPPDNFLVPSQQFRWHPPEISCTRQRNSLKPSTQENYQLVKLVLPFCGNLPIL